MKTKMPDLQVGRTYRIEDVRHYLDNYNITLSHRNQYSSVVGMLYFGQRDEEIVLEYQEFPFQTLFPYIQQLHDDLIKHSKEKDVITEIKNRLLNGDVAWPLLILKGYKHPVCPDCLIQEGMHRAVAHLLISSEILPVFVMRYIEDTDGKLF